jgi:hypothetical protein
MANTINTSSLTVKRVAGGRAWYQVLDRDGKEMSSGWQKIAWRGEWMPGSKAQDDPGHFRGNTRGNTCSKPHSHSRKKTVHRTKG